MLGLCSSRTGDTLIQSQMVREICHQPTKDAVMQIMQSDDLNFIMLKAIKKRTSDQKKEDRSR